MKTVTNLEEFERIYATDLIYVPDCWKLCGDAHCCSFSRYKSRFKLIARRHFQELPLLPGEYQFLSAKNWLDQFGEYEHKVIEFPIDGAVVRAESIVSFKPDCACEHAIRPTICRLYPRLPVFDIAGRLIGTDAMGIYEEIERIEHIPGACQVSSIPFDQLSKFLDISAVLGKIPQHLFYIEAYRVKKNHVTARLEERCSETERDSFSEFEVGFIRKNLVDYDELRSKLSELYSRFFDYWGDSFQLN